MLTDKIEYDEQYERPDVILLCLDPYTKEKVYGVVDWDEINDINGDFGTVTDLAVVGILIYPDGDKALENATRYVFNQIEIHEKTKENKELLNAIGNS